MKSMISGENIFRMVVLLSVFTGGCRHTPAPVGTGRSSFVVVRPPPAPSPKSSPSEAKEPTTNSEYHEAQPNYPLIMPVYPPQALAAKAGWATVGVKITVDVTGRVADIRASMVAFSTPGPFAEEFLKAVETALRQWRFIPAENRKMVYVENKDISYYRVTRREATETELDLMFTFTASGSVQQGTPGK